jgi:hypothetical protein
MAKPIPTEKQYRENPFCGYCDEPLPPRENGMSQWSHEKYAGKTVWLCVECHYLERVETNPGYAQERIKDLNNEGKCLVCYVSLTAHNTHEHIASCLSIQRMRWARTWIDSLREKIAKGASGWTTEEEIVKYRRIIEEADPRFK